MTERRRRAAEEDVDRPRKRRKKADTGPSALPIILVILGLFLLAGLGVGAYFLFSGGSDKSKGGGGDGANLAEDLSDRFLGTSEGPIPESPSITLHLDVYPSSIKLTMSDKKTGKTRTGFYPWKVVRASENEMLVRGENPQNHESFDWTI